MARIYMVRHGKAASGWGDDLDPGLDELGQSQAEAVAEKLAPLGPMTVLTSPLKRTQETAAPLAALWGTSPAIADAVAEIPSPTKSLAERKAWLMGAMSGSFDDLDQDYRDWRDGVVAFVRNLTEDTVIFSHFIAINVLVNAVEGSDRVVTFAPDNCSVSIFDVDGTRLSLIEKGHEATTEVR